MKLQRAVLVISACFALTACANQSKSSVHPEYAAAQCPKGTVRYCDRRSEAGCQCNTRQDTESIKALFY